MDRRSTLAVLAELVGLSIPAEDEDLLAALFENHLNDMAKLMTVDTQDVEPITSLDPSWD